MCSQGCGPELGAAPRAQALRGRRPRRVACQSACERQARRLALMQAGTRGRTHPLRTGRPPGYAKDRLRRDPLQRKLKDFWHFCHWADEAAYRPPDCPEGRPAPA